MQTGPLFHAMTDFQSCPSFPGNSAARDGTIQRDASTKIGKRGNQLQRPAQIIAHVGRDRAYVTLAGKFVRWSTMVEDAWPDDGRPEPLYHGARVLTVAEWIAELRK